MALQWRDLRDWRGVTGRRDYATWGVLLFTVKYNLDRAIATGAFDRGWFPWSYLSGEARVFQYPGDLWLYGALLVLSLPFIWAGVVLTLRRLRDAGWRPVLVTLFFVPFVNLLFFSLLCVQPSREPPPLNAPVPAWWRRVLLTENTVAAAGLGLLASVMLGVSLTAFGAVFLQNYGWGLFIGIPFLMGLTSTLFYSAARPRAWFECLGVAMASIGLAGGLLVVLAIEGVFCILMALPVAAALALLGAGVGYWIQIEHWSRRLDHVRACVAPWFALTLLMTVEARLPSTPPLIEATTVCEIAAPPSVVWRHVISFSELPPPREMIFQAGIAYPVHARLDGRGVGAIRHCEFSTGPFVEPITVWVENERLAFDVIAQPHPMREWSPYSSIEPAHLEGFFRSQRGEFRLTPLDGGRRTRLAGTTWYEQDIWPQAYWRPWSDYLVHSIHRRVLTHIQHLAEVAE